MSRPCRHPGQRTWGGHAVGLSRRGREETAIKENVVKGERAYEKVLDYIRSEVRRGNLKRGERLPPERELAEQLGVSRNSVREAVRTLSLMGFVSSIQGAGNYISCDLEGNLSASFEMMLLLGETNYLQVSQLRRGLESETARLAATRILPGQLERLKGLAQRMADEPDPEKGALMDQQFHMLLCEASGNLLLRSLFRAMVATVNRFIGTMYVRIVGDEDQARQLHEAHLEIVQALAEGDENAAIQGIWRHFQVVEEAILTMP